MKYFTLTFYDNEKKIAVNDDHSFVPYQNYDNLGPLLAVTELTLDEFKTSELADLTAKEPIVKEETKQIKK